MILLDFFLEEESSLFVDGMTTLLTVFVMRSGGGVECRLARNDSLSYCRRLIVEFFLSLDYYSPSEEDSSN